jgi:hypothetical protein
MMNRKARILGHPLSPGDALRRPVAGGAKRANCLKFPQKSCRHGRNERGPSPLFADNYFIGA